MIDWINGFVASFDCNHTFIVGRTNKHWTLNSEHIVFHRPHYFFSNSFSFQSALFKDNIFILAIILYAAAVILSTVLNSAAKLDLNFMEMEAEKSMKCVIDCDFLWLVRCTMIKCERKLVVHPGSYLSIVKYKDYNI